MKGSEVQITVKLDRELYSELRNLASIERTSITEQIRRLLRHRLSTVSPPWETPPQDKEMEK